VKSSPESATTNTLSPDALRLLLDSAKAGDAGAQLALAVRYANGDGVRPSYPEAFKWFTRAQAQGVVPRKGQAAEAWSKIQQWAQSHPQKSSLRFK
jgi:TPR repeat protein